VQPRRTGNKVANVPEYGVRQSCMILGERLQRVVLQPAVRIRKKEARKKREYDEES